MFAAGSGAEGSLGALLDSGASLAARDRRGKGILDYAPPDSPVRTILEDRSAICFVPPFVMCVTAAGVLWSLVLLGLRAPVLAFLLLNWCHSAVSKGQIHPKTEGIIVRMLPFFQFEM